MTLIKSISGIRGTIGGKEGDNLTPVDVVRFSSAFGKLIQERSGKNDPLIVIGRDARMSGIMVRDLVIATLNGMGIHVIDCGLSTTPTVEMAVEMAEANGGIILTASHNPKEWNALKLLNEKGEFISAEEGKRVLEIAASGSIEFAYVDKLGTSIQDSSYLQKHIASILTLPYVDQDLIKKAGLTVALDAINSSGAIAVPQLLDALGVECVVINDDPSGDFAHNPEPLPAHLEGLSNAVKDSNCALGISVDPDVDRLAFVCEDGSMFGEEYTLVAVADYILSVKNGATVSNLSSSRALRDVTQNAGGEYHASAVGEVNVVQKMKEVNAVIGGEGNGGIIVPDLHYGRDALVGIAIFLTHFVKKGMTMTALKASYPQYTIIKNKIQLTPDLNVDELLEGIKERFSNEELNTVDGVKIDFTDGWVHLRKSNTEPIIRVYAEAATNETANELASKVMKEVDALVGVS